MCESSTHPSSPPRLAVALTLSGVYQVPALYCTVLYCTVLHCTVLYCTVLYCTVQPWLARWLGHWASFNWAVFSLFGLTLAVPLLLPESCRWLIANDKKDEVQGASVKSLSTFIYVSHLSISRPYRF